MVRTTRTACPKADATRSATPLVALAGGTEASRRVSAVLLSRKAKVRHGTLGAPATGA